MEFSSIKPASSSLHLARMGAFLLATAIPSFNAFADYCPCGIFPDPKYNPSIFNYEHGQTKKVIFTNTICNKVTLVFITHAEPVSAGEFSRLSKPNWDDYKSILQKQSNGPGPMRAAFEDALTELTAQQNNKNYWFGLEMKIEFVAQYIRDNLPTLLKTSLAPIAGDEQAIQDVLNIYYGPLPGALVYFKGPLPHFFSVDKARTDNKEDDTSDAETDKRSVGAVEAILQAAKSGPGYVQFGGAHTKVMLQELMKQCVQAKRPIKTH